MPCTQHPAEPTVADAMLNSATLSGPACTVGDLRTLFKDDHIHAAVVVDQGRLVTVVERSDLTPQLDHAVPAAALGHLRGRVLSPDVPLEQARLRMLEAGLRRLAIIDDQGRYRGLLCLKRSGTGFCSDQDVRTRTADRRASGRTDRPAV